MTLLKSTILLLVLLLTTLIPAWCQDAGTYLKSGREKMKKNDKKGALEDFNKAIELKPDMAEAYVARGNVVRFLGVDEGDEKASGGKALADYNKDSIKR